MANTSELLVRTLQHATDWFANLATRPVNASLSADELRAALATPLPQKGDAPERVIDRLANTAAKGVTASAGPRYFGFVVGGSLPAAVAADWLVSSWDQNSGLYVLSPFVSVVEQVAGSWLRELAGLPEKMSVGFVTGCQMANFTSLAAARHRVLRDAGWDVEANGLFGAPPIEVFIGDEAHYTILMALRLLGLGSNRVHRIPTDEQGRMRADALKTQLAKTTGPAVVCAQAGNVNTGAFDPLPEIADAAKSRGAWLHVDGAFGLWAAASPKHAHLVAGIDRADSIASDGHKWLNVPYDCGIVFCADEAAHRSAMSLTAAAYIVETRTERDPHEFVPEESRRARAVPVYAALASLGRDGYAELVERNCRGARKFAEALRTAGHEILNHVVLNQVLVSFGSPEETRRIIAAIQSDGTCWASGTVWHGHTALRISVSNWSTTDADIDQSIAAILRLAASAHHS
jgi:glutamate/tyrosine decarboxylase-like PLP-dependent enzyme